MSARGWIAGASRPRAAAEVGLATFALILPLSAILRPALASGLARAGVPVAESGWPLLGIGLAYAGYFAALLGAVRLREPSGPRRGWGSG